MIGGPTTEREDSPPADGGVLGNGASAAAGAGEPSQELLRRVASDVLRAFPHRSDASELVLIDVDPRHLHAFWNVPIALAETVRGALDPSDQDAPMVLRISADDGSEAPLDVEVVGLQGQYYVDVWSEPRRYRAALGFRRADSSLATLLDSKVASLPPLGPADEDVWRLQRALPEEKAPPAAVAATEDAATGDAGTGDAAQPPPSFRWDAADAPVEHPFPPPPSEPGAFDPAALAPTTAQAAPFADLSAADAPADATPVAVAAAEDAGSPAVEDAAPAPPVAPPDRRPPVFHWLASDDPVIHPFPLPPSEPDAFDPAALAPGGPSDHAAPQPTSDQPAESAAPGGEETRPAGEREASAEGPPPLALENAVTLSSYALGREAVEFEINAELHIFGRARPGMELQLFGRKVPIRPDGTFSITRPLPNGALIVSALLAGDGRRED